MTDPAPTGTRQRILATAEELFAERGYQRTSISVIADRLSLTKGAILYHFSSKDAIMATLVEPLLVSLEQVVAEAENLPPERGRWTVIEGWLDTMITYGRPLRTLARDLSIFTRSNLYARFFQAAYRAHQMVAGPGADLGTKVRAVQAVGTLGDALIYYQDVPAETLRPLILAGTRRLLEDCPPHHDEPEPAALPHRPMTSSRPPAASTPARSQPATSAAAGLGGRGRPRAMTAERQRLAEELLTAGMTSPAQLAAAIGVSRATVYRYLRVRRDTVFETYDVRNTVQREEF